MKAWFDGAKHYLAFPVCLVLLVMFITTGITALRSSEEEAASLRINAKTEYIMSDAYTDLDIVGSTWESRFNQSAPYYDVFLIDTDSEGLVRVSVHDTEVNGKYPVERYELSNTIQ